MSPISTDIKKADIGVFPDRPSRLRWMRSATWAAALSENGLSENGLSAVTGQRPTLARRCSTISSEGSTRTFLSVSSSPQLLQVGTA